MRRTTLQEVTDAREALVKHHAMMGPALCTPAGYIEAIYALYGIAPEITKTFMRLGDIWCRDGQIGMSS